MKLEDETHVGIAKLRLTVVESNYLPAGPRIATDPASGLSNVPRICSKVVFPAPEAPTMLMTSPFAMSRSMPLSTGRDPYDFLIPLADMMEDMTTSIANSLASRGR